MFIKCKEYWYDQVVRIYSKRMLAINVTEISSYHTSYHSELKKTVLRVNLKDGNSYLIDNDFNSFSESLALAMGLDAEEQ